MTSHELAKKLLEMPDIVVGYYDEFGFQNIGEIRSQNDVKPFGWGNTLEPVVLVLDCE